MEESNPPENRNINTGGGNYNERIEGDYIQGNVFQNIFNILGGQTTTPVGDPARPKNERLLLAAVKEEVTARLRQSLHNAVLINLGKESQPQQVKRPWDAEIKIGLKPAVPLPDTTTTLEVFDSEEIVGKLLILGAPGAGKTTTQLELAQALVKRAEEQPDYPVPVLFNLSSWKGDRQHLTDWLAAELNSKYGISKKLCCDLIENKRFLPLLDGLDELEPTRQEYCVQAINQLLQKEFRPQHLVVCSRYEEYNNYETRLNLNGAIYLQKLSNQQIQDYLTAINYTELWDSLNKDINFVEFLTVPFLLSITILAYQSISIEQWQSLNSTVERLQYLLNTYIQSMLAREIYNVNQDYQRQNFSRCIQNRKIKQWLIWLAQQLQRELRTEFLIEKLQPYLLSMNDYKIYFFLSKIIVSLLIAIIFGLMIGLSLGIIGIEYAWLLGIFITMVVFISLIFFEIITNFSWNLDEKIKPNEIIIWSWKAANITLVRAITIAIIFGLIFKTLSIVINIIDYQNIFSSLGVFLSLLLMVVLEINSNLNIKTIKQKIIPNQGILISYLNAGISWLFFGVFNGIIIGLFYWLIFGINLKTLFVLVALMLCIRLPAGLENGGKACLQHFILRLILYFNGYIPWNYARFLDYCTERLFLQRVGGRYRFIHKLLQDHFAKMEFRRD